MGMVGTETQMVRNAFMPFGCTLRKNLRWGLMWGVGVPNYRRANVLGGTYFFTVVTYRRQRFLCDDDVRIALRAGIEKTRQCLPFDIDAWVLLPDHLHSTAGMQEVGQRMEQLPSIWTLPPGDADFGKRWGLIKRHVSKHCGDIKRDNWMNDSKRKRNESTLWQRRFWEHQIRDERGYKHHVDYVHFNPVKHGIVDRVADWPHSTFHRFVNDGVYAMDWAGDLETNTATGFGE